MKTLLIIATLALSGLTYANSGLGQSSDPVGGDQSRCCNTGNCKGLRLCADTAFGNDRSVANKGSQSTKKAKSKETSRQ